MHDPSEKSSRRVLDPADRMSEILCGLIMVLTFTGSLSVAQAGRSGVRAMLIGALGCNLAWGMIDAVLYLLGRLAAKIRDFATLQTLRQTTDPATAHRRILVALPATFASVLQSAELEVIHQRLRQLPEPPAHARLDRRDWLGALGVFSLVFLVTCLVVIPFLIIANVITALRVSHAIAITLLFLTGYSFGRRWRKPWLTGIAMVVLGTILAGITIALGG
jgi:hypothetical protein